MNSYCLLLCGLVCGVNRVTANPHSLVTSESSAFGTLGLGKYRSSRPPEDSSLIQSDTSAQ